MPSASVARSGALVRSAPTPNTSPTAYETTAIRQSPGEQLHVDAGGLHHQLLDLVRDQPIAQAEHSMGRSAEAGPYFPGV
jgi:hypothetical protein